LHPIEGLFANRGLLQVLARFLKPMLAGARQEEQRGQEPDDQERRYRYIPTAQSIECLTQDVRATRGPL
jgi:hypothetical protein